MKTKVLEVRDSGTRIPVLAIDMNPHFFLEKGPEEIFLRSCGYPCDGQPNVAICHLSMPSNGRITNDYYEWRDRTYATAHRFITEKWNELKDGDVVDVEFIMGETNVKKTSEIMSEMASLTFS